MNWTKTPPSKPGAYWWRAHSEHAFPRLFEVWESGLVFGDLPSHCRDEDGNKLPARVNHVGGEWCGPLVPVEKVEKAHEEGWKYALSHGPHSKFDAWKESHAHKIVEGEL